MQSSRFRHPAAAASQAGFTLAELLVVIGILVLIAGLLLPMVMRATATGTRTRIAADLQAISVALDQYKADHGDYPRVPGDPSDANYMTGAQILCRSLFAPGPAVTPAGATDDVGDGADGPGFRIRGTQGRVYGPYLKSEQFRLRDPANLDNTAPDPNNLNLVLIDHNDHPILYFPARPGKLNLTINGAYIAQSDTSMFDARDNLDAFEHSGDGAANAFLRIQVMLGDYDTDTTITPGSVAATEKPYLLWSAGLDGNFGPNEVSDVPGDAAANQKAAEDCDDVTNFNVNP